MICKHIYVSTSLQACTYLICINVSMRFHMAVFEVCIDVFIRVRQKCVCVCYMCDVYAQPCPLQVSAFLPSSHTLSRTSFLSLESRQAAGLLPGQGLLFDSHLLALGVLSKGIVTASNAGVELIHMVLHYLCLQQSSRHAKIMTTLLLKFISVLIS